MTAAEKLNNSAALGVLAKVAMFLTPILVSIGLFVIGNFIASGAKAYSDLETRVTVGEQIAAALDKRTSLLEQAIANGRSDRLAAQQETKSALKDLDQRTVEILKAIARLEAKL